MTVQNYELQIWEELSGMLSRVSPASGNLLITIRLKPKSVTLTIPRESLIGDLPSPKSQVTILRTDRGYRARAMPGGSSEANKEES